MSRLPIVHHAVRVEHGDAGVPPDVAAASDATARADLQDGDLHGILVAFYEAIADDELLAPYFAEVDMAAHMPRIVDFWSTLIFHTGRYTGNAFRPHLSMRGLSAAHFARWLQALEATVDARCAGEAAERMKALGHRIAYSMQVRLGIHPWSSPFAEA